MALMFFYDQQPNSHMLLHRLDLFPKQIKIPVDEINNTLIDD